MKRSSTAVFVGLAAALLVVAYLLARCGEEKLGGKGATVAPVVKQVEYPRERAVRLKKHPAQADQNKPETPTPTVGRDKLARTLSSPGKDGALVIEVNAIRHSPLVEKMLACEQARKGDASSGLDALRDELGVDVTEDVDRVAFDKDVLAVSGFFKDLKLPEGLGAGEAFGNEGRIFKVKDDDGKDMVIGKVGDELLVTGFSEEQVKGAIDRAEGRAETAAPFPNDVAGGEIYGLVGAAFLQDLLGSAKDPMAQRLATVIKQSTLQVAVDDAAALSMNIDANSPEEGRDLGKALGGMISMARQEAQARGDDELVGLLDQGKVDIRDDGSVAVDVAVPGDTLLRLFGCTADGRPIDMANAAPDAPAPKTR